MNNQQLMQWAKTRLVGGWGMAALVTLIYSVITGLSGYLYLVPLLIVGPFSYGIFKYLTIQVDYRKQDVNLLFEGFQGPHFLNTLVAGLLISLATALGFVLLIVPGVILSLGFSMTYLIMLDDPRISGVEAMKESWRLMDGHKWELFCLYLRFFGWLLLCILTVGILSFWIQPYILTAQIGFYRQIRGRVL